MEVYRGKVSRLSSCRVKKKGDTLMGDGIFLSRCFWGYIFFMTLVFMFGLIYLANTYIPEMRTNTNIIINSVVNPLIDKKDCEIINVKGQHIILECEGGSVNDPR